MSSATFQHQGSHSPQSKSAKSTPQTKRFQKIADLDYVTIKKLANRLDIPGERNWRRLIEVMPNCRYDTLTVERFGLNASRSDGSPAYAMLTDMSNRGITYDQLIGGLKKMQLDTALQDIGYRESVQITQQPEATPGVEGQQLVLECKATGVPRPSFLWFKTPRIPLPNQTSDSLIIPQLTKEDAGMYCCRAENEVNVVFSAWVEVKVQKKHVLKTESLPGSHEITESPKIILQSHSEIEVTVEGELRLFVEATCGSGGQLFYQWIRDGKKLNYGTVRELLIKPARLEDQGTYFCRVTSEHGGSSLTNSSQVIVTDPNQPQNVGGNPPMNQQQPLLSPPIPSGGGGVSQYTQVTPSPLASTGQVPSSNPSVEPHYTSSSHSHEHQMIHVQYNPNPLPDYADVRYPNEFENHYNMGGQQDPNSPYNDNHVQYGGYVAYTPAEVFNNAQYHPGVGGMFNPQHQGLPPPHHNPQPMGAYHQQHTTDTPSSDYTRDPNGMGSQPVVDAEINLPQGQDQPPDLNDSCYDKVALLIGNKYYQRGELKLNTPENDTQDMAGVLLSADFKVVSLVNLNKQEMEAAVKYFESLIGKNVYALFFFAGHGFELNGKNFMMPVDADVEKNPDQCLCAQKVLQTMQSKGAKLSIVLLDMCRVNASTVSMPSKMDLFPNPQGTSTSGYFVIGFSCSPMERAYEAGAGQELKEEDRDNSIFVSAFKRHLQSGCLRERLDTLLTDAAAGVRKRGEAFNTPLNSWQKPEIRHNLGEKLSLADPIKNDVEPNNQRKERSLLWQSAHIVPDSVVVGCNGNKEYNTKPGELSLRLHFEAEHSNVLIVTAELLNGCLTTCEVLGMDMTLHQYDEKTGVSLLNLRCHEDNKQYKYNQNTKFAYGHYQAEKEMDLMHFKIPDLQKIRTQTVTLKISVEYRIERRGKYREHRHCEIQHVMSPPLYAKILSKVKETPSTSQYVQPYYPRFSPASHHT